MGKIKVNAYVRRKRPKGKRKILSKKSIRLHLIRDEFGRYRGWQKMGKR